jgi:conjugal transfer/entry exclusion protein
MQEILLLLRHIEETEKIIDKLQKDVTMYANELYVNRLKLIALQQEYLHIIEDMRGKEM